MSFRKILAAALEVPESATDEQMARKLAELLKPPAQPSSSVVRIDATDDPQADFEKLAEIWAKTHNVSLAEGYRQVSMQAPTLYERACQAADINRVRL